MVKCGQNDVFLCHVKTFTFEKQKKFICVHKQCFDITAFINTYVGLQNKWFKPHSRNDYIYIQWEK